MRQQFMAKPCCMWSRPSNCRLALRYHIPKRRIPPDSHWRIYLRPSCIENRLVCQWDVRVRPHDSWLAALLHPWHGACISSPVECYCSIKPGGLQCKTKYVNVSDLVRFNLTGSKYPDTTSQRRWWQLHLDHRGDKCSSHANCDCHIWHCGEDSFPYDTHKHMSQGGCFKGSTTILTILHHYLS